MLNKTPKESAKKIKLARNVVPIVLVFLIGLVLAVALLQQREGSSASVDNGCNGLRLNSDCFQLYMADTPEERTLGLSGRDSLPSNTGMLFTFPDSAKHCFWMKDMKFNIDIIWFSSDKNITKIEHNVSPATYPNTFCSDHTKYVIELDSGVAKQYSLSVGQQLEF